MNHVRLGYELGSGAPVDVPISHLAITGQTQNSGKTTTLEALVRRSGQRALAFRTKRAEGAFTDYATHPPYFRERADWQFVAAILEATLRERLKFQRPWIMKVCRGTKTLTDVQRNVQKALETAKGLTESVYTELDAYLDIVVPQIATLPLAKSIKLHAGINVMDLTEYSAEMQALVIRSALEWIYEREQEVITIIPEAWEVIPQARSSPVLFAAEQLVRKGAASENFLWIDSQDIAGVNKNILRSVSVWILGVQREANEIKRTLGHVHSTVKPKVLDIAQLERGQFVACFGKEVRKVYVQPAWLNDEDGRRVARGEMSRSEVTAARNGRSTQDARVSPREREAALRDGRNSPHYMPPSRQREERRAEEEAARTKGGKVNEKEATLLRNENRELKAKVERLERESLRQDPANPRSVTISEPVVSLSPGFDAFSVPPGFDTEALRRTVLEILEREAPRLGVTVNRPELEVRVKREVVQVDGKSGDGWIGRLISDGFFDEAKNGNMTFKELKRRGAALSNRTAYDWCQGMVHRGFLTLETDGYRAAPGMKVNIVEEG